MIHNGKELMNVAKRVTDAAQIVRMFAQSMVFLRPIASKTAPVRMRPTPLQTERTPTKETASDSGADTESARSLAKLITVLPTAAKKESVIKAIQKEGRRIICAEVKSCFSKPSVLFAFEALGCGSATFASGFFKIKAAKAKTTHIAQPKMTYVLRQPSALLNMELATLPKIRAEEPKPIMRQPEHRPFLSGNHALTVAMTTL